VADGKPVLLVETSPFLGGAARSLLDMLGVLAQSPFRPILAAASEEVCASARAEGIEAWPVDFPAPSRSLAPWRSLPALARILAARGELRRMADRRGVRLVHSNSTWAHLIAGDLLGLPCIWHCRDLTRLSMLAGRLADTASVVVATSHAVAGHLASQGVPPGMVRVIHNGVAVRGLPGPEERPAVRAALRAQWRIGPDAPVLAWVGEFAPWKRTEDFLAMVAELRRSHPAVRGLVFGAALAQDHQGREATLIGLADKLGVGAAVTFLGWQPDVPRSLVAADLLVLTSENEPFGRVLVEAMAAGVPVIARNGGGVAEVLGEEAALLIEAPSVGDFVAAADRLLSDRAEAARMAEAGISRAREMFGPELAAERLARLYGELTP